MTKSNRLTARFVASYLSSLDCPRSLAVYLLWKYSEHDQLALLDIVPSDYSTEQSFRDAYLATKFLSKANFLDTSFNVKDVALRKFCEAETQCRLTNQAFSFVNRDKLSPLTVTLLSVMSRKIANILGPFDGDEWFDACDWGPGVTLSNKRDTSDVKKYLCETDITADLHDLVYPLFPRGYPLWQPKFSIVVGNKIVTVPKNSKTDRTIAIEPGLNLWFQKGVGSMIRRRLLRVGIDLNNQSRNQRLCKLSSKTGHLATVDFSAASDTISKSLVEEVLPLDWWLVLDCCRSKYYSDSDGSVRQYEKFSSMGNGSTFELESLIFYAAAYAVTTHMHGDVDQISVYGDDVLLPTNCYPLFASFCKNIGFTVNSSKSYSTGFFRESCGSHFYRGTDCKPYYLKEVIRDENDVYKAANSVRRLAYRSHYYGCDRRFRSAWQILHDVTRRWKHRPCYISEGYGDGGFIVNFDEAVPQRAKHGIEGFYAKSVVSRTTSYESDSGALLLARLRRPSVDISLGNDVPCKRSTRYTRKRILIRRWEDLGPWI